MKKLLLSIALLSGVLTATNAQITSFETTEGFLVGNLNGQNGWGASATALATVSSTYASGVGTQSLKLTGNNGTNHALAGAFSPDYTITGTTITLAFDAYFTNISGTASDFFISPQSPTQQLITSRIRFAYDGNIYVLDEDDLGELGYLDTEADFAINTWYNVKVVHNFADANIQYYIDNNLIYTSVLPGATMIENITFLNDNYNSTAYFDNIQLVVGTLGVEQNDALSLSLYPNPAQDNVTIANPNNLVINNIAITDLNGKVVMNQNSVINSQINISDLAVGMYFVKITTDSASVTKKIIKN